MRIGFVIAHGGAVDATWTTIHLAKAALDRGDTVRFVEPWDFEVTPERRLIARAHAFDAPLSADAMVAALNDRTADRRYVTIGDLDALFLRIASLDRPVLAFARMAEEHGVAVINAPGGLLATAHKGWLASLPGVPIPRTLVTRSRASALLFYESLDVAVVKPARGLGGHGVLRVEGGRVAAFEEAFDRVACAGDRYVVVQEFIDDREEGERRLVWADGEVMGAYLRRRAPLEFRHNLKQGAQPEFAEIRDLDREICRSVRVPLQRLGIRLAGLDVMGSHLLEVNVLNPGGVFHAERLSGRRVSGHILNRLCPSTPKGLAAWQPQKR